MKTSVVRWHDPESIRRDQRRSKMDSVNTKRALVTAVDVRLKEPISRVANQTKRLTVGCGTGCDIQLPSFLLGLPSEQAPSKPFMTLRLSRYNPDLLFIRMERWVKLGFINAQGTEEMIAPKKEWSSGRKRCCLRRVELNLGVQADRSLNVYNSSEKDVNTWKYAFQLQILATVPTVKGNFSSAEVDEILADLGFQMPHVLEFLPPPMLERIFLSSSVTNVALGLAGISKRFFQMAQWGIYYADVTALRFTERNPSAALGFLSILSSPGDSIVDLGMPIRVLEISNITGENVPLTKPFLFKEMADFFELVPNLKKLVIGKGSIRFKSAAKKFKFQSLEELHMHWDCVEFDDPFPFENFQLLHTVVLAVFGVKRFGHGHGTKALRDLPHLKVLSLAELPLSWTWTVSKVVGLMNPGLEVLRLPFVNCTNEEFLDFIPEMCPKLKQLEVPGARVQYKNVVQLFFDIPSLEVVDIFQPSRHRNKTENVLKLRHSRSYIAPNGPLGHKLYFHDIMGNETAQLVGNKYLLKNIDCAIQYGVPVRLEGEWRMVAADLNEQREKWAVDGQLFSTDADDEDE